MRISNWSILGFIAAAAYAGVTTYHYWIQYPDISQFIMNMATAFLIAAVSWLYSQNQAKSNDIVAIEDYLDDKREILK